MRTLMSKTYYRLFPAQRPQKLKEGEFDDTFTVGADGSISLNYESKTVQGALSKNIKKLQSMKEEK